jgi:hypothetical protein
LGKITVIKTLALLQDTFKAWMKDWIWGIFKPPFE